jgi:hypothetical protein
VRIVKHDAAVGKPDHHRPQRPETRICAGAWLWTTRDIDRRRTVYAAAMDLHDSRWPDTGLADAAATPVEPQR